jgi:hypothetical protein
MFSVIVLQGILLASEIPERAVDDLHSFQDAGQLVRRMAVTAESLI